MQAVKIAAVWVMLIGAVLSASADVTLPKILGNEMVLQQKKPVPIWGKAVAGEKVEVEFHGQHKQTTADAQGDWKVLLDPMPASATPATLVIRANNTITLGDILVGEVWLCSGQSNMEYSMRKNSKVVKTDSSANSPIDELQWAKNPMIRIFLVTSKNLRAADPSHSGWGVARDSALRAFSAAGYFFAKELYSKLQVPIGVISSAVPGSAIEPWMTVTVHKDSLHQAAAGNVQSQLPGYSIDTASAGKFVPTMVQPLSPFAIKGFLWYQGETNCFQNETAEYTGKMELLIQGWRKLWGDRRLPFYYVGIAPFYYSRTKNQYPLNEETLPRFWVAQSMVMKEVPHTGMVVTTDLVRTPDDLHPGFKWEVGRRLAQWPLAEDYGLKLTPSGPVLKKVLFSKGKARLQFEYAGQGLVSRDGKPLSWFSIAGQDGKFVPAGAVIQGNEVIVSVAAVTEPTAVRFAWSEGAQPNLFNKDGLPAMPFSYNSKVARDILALLPSVDVQ